MADVRGFRGIRYAKDVLDDSGVDVVAPPYDVIDDTEQSELYERHPHNIIRLILNRQTEADTDENNRYTRSRRHFMDWMAQGVLEREEDPSMYVHYQDYVGAQGTSYTRRGFLGLVRLTEYDREIVLPHERTLKGPKVDRLELMKETECNMSPVFLLYEDADRSIDRILSEHCDDAPMLDVETDHDGIRHRMWSVTDAQAQRQVRGVLEDEQLLIADGHHRYETALAYRDFRRRVDEVPKDDAPYDYALAFFVNMHDPGLQIFPTHRLVHGVEGFDADEFADALHASEYFDVRPIDENAQISPDRVVDVLGESGNRAPSFAILAEAWDRPLLVQFTGDEHAPVFDADTGEEVRKLDTAILHEAILDRMVGIDKKAQKEKRNLRYTRNLDEAVGAVDRSDNQFVVLMNPTEVSQVVEVCKSGGKLPQKSTYFYPKVLSGLTINPL